MKTEIRIVAVLVNDIEVNESADGGAFVLELSDRPDDEWSKRFGEQSAGKCSAKINAQFQPPRLVVSCVAGELQRAYDAAYEAVEATNASLANEARERQRLANEHDARKAAVRESMLKELIALKKKP